MRRLYIAGNLPEAHMVVYMLEAAGIEVQVFNDHAQGALGEIPFTQTYPEVWIMHNTDYRRAREMITEFESRQAVTGSIVCRRCGEPNPANFSICWQCGDELDSPD